MELWLYTIFSFAFGTLCGFSVGLTGGGGVIIAVPLLVYGLGLDSHTAVFLSLVMMAVIAIWGAVHAHRRGEVDVVRGGLFALGALIAFPGGDKLSTRLPSQLLILLFAGFMLAVAVRMYVESRKSELAKTEFLEPPPPLPLLRQMLSFRGGVAFVLALICGLLSGLFGIGGGIVMVPALVWAFRMDLKHAIGTALFAIAWIASLGAAIKGLEGGFSSVPPEIIALFLLGGIVGIEVGSRLRFRMPEGTLKQAFATLIALVAILIFLTGGHN